jgi:putative transposase
MTYNPDIHHRRSIRLRGYDYSSAGAYFVTLCAQNRECLFGDIVDGVMVLNELGHVVLAEWERTPEIRKEIKLDVAVVMPNHFHGIICIVDDGVSAGTTGGAGATGRSPQQWIKGFPNAQLHLRRRH